MYLIGIDDTDSLESRGTGNLARQIAAELSRSSLVLGVTRHQLLVDPRIPYTKNNSSAAILVETNTPSKAVLEQVLSILNQSIQPGSDPGVCLAVDVPTEISTFGFRAKRELVTQEEARQLADARGIYLQGLAGDEGGVIGALAAVGLAASGEDGRYIQVGKIRELSGMQPLGSLLEAGIETVKSLDGQTLQEGTIWVEKLRPARRGGKPVAFVEKLDRGWRLVKLD